MLGARDSEVTAVAGGAADVDRARSATPTRRAGYPLAGVCVRGARAGRCSRPH